jgi:hypothetical protein
VTPTYTIAYPDRLAGTFFRYEIQVQNTATSVITNESIAYTDVAPLPLVGSTLAAGQSYRVWVRAQTFAGDYTPWSDPIYYAPKLYNGALVTGPAAVVTDQGAGNVTVSWDSYTAGNGDTVFDAYVQGLSGGVSTVQIVSSSQGKTVTSLDLSGLSPGTYKVWLRARDSQYGGVTDWSTDFVTFTI